MLKMRIHFYHDFFVLCYSQCSKILKKKKVQYKNVLLYDYVSKVMSNSTYFFNSENTKPSPENCTFCSTFRALCACAALCSVLYFNEFSMEDSFNPLSKHEKPILTI